MAFMESAIANFIWVCFTWASKLVLLYIIAEKIWPAIQMLRYVLMPYFLPNEQPLQSRYGSWAVITGSTDGIGKAYAFELAKRNINVVLISRSEEKLLKTALEIEAKYTVKTKIIVADFTQCNVEFYKNIANQLDELPIGILVNNVGMNHVYPMYLHELSEKQAMDLLNVNMTSMTMMTRIVLPIMLKNNRGVIVNVSSGSEMQPWPLMTLYAASKAFVKNFTDAIRYEYSKKGIQVQNLAPMFTNTKMNDFSSRLRETSLTIPTPQTYAKHAIRTLGKLNHTTGYWPHGIQYFFSSLAPYYFRLYIAGYLNQIFRKEYLAAQLKEH